MAGILREANWSPGRSFKWEPWVWLAALKVLLAALRVGEGGAPWWVWTVGGYVSSPGEGSSAERRVLAAKTGGDVQLWLYLGGAGGSLDK